ncbi:MAG TPA: GGDEF domain-containing protein [Bradyrhizobium sp.]|uniref:GGDEF domain-containing protein n=1 Tax=Bradyrhizobium sp. TaxID=376 RepID=UPI002BB55A44|nr:GGDEF domain-containing protein [Bradyrhizobium sp.]HTB03537.1 GGDEF domain-containing protein [Bradyrhizobium sp.]
MLSVPTLWTAFVVNFLALGLIWAYVARSYPKFEAAPFWTGSAFAGAGGAAVAMLRFDVDSLLPLVLGGTVMIFAACLATMGIKRFYDQPVSWRGTALITGLSCAVLTFFVIGYDSIQMRIMFYSIGQSVPMALALKPLLSRRDGRVNHGARLAGVVCALIIAIYAIRAGGTLLHVGGNYSITHANPVQSVLVLILMFLSMSVNFGFLLMAIDRLRNEVADLALLDDLTGVGNRRYLLQRLSEECAKSDRSREPFALLVVDLDGFKAINDTHGHAAGDACLQHFTLMAQTRLRPGDMLARTGGDEFCVVLPASTLREGAMIARRILDVCRLDAEACVGADIPISLSIGVAQWTREIGAFPDRLMAAADHALYAAKRDGKNRCAIYDPAPPLVPVLPAMPQPALRKHA